MSDLREQSQELMQMPTVAVRALDNLDTIRPALRALGRRHVGYGITEQHFGTVAAALVWTLETALGPRFTPDVRHAWIVVYGVLVATMREGMEHLRSTALANA